MLCTYIEADILSLRLTVSRIMFMREFRIIDSADSADKLRMRLKDGELERYGDSFIPEYVYDVIKSLPRFSSMRVSLAHLLLCCTKSNINPSADINRMLRSSWGSYSPVYTTSVYQ